VDHKYLIVEVDSVACFKAEVVTSQSRLTPQKRLHFRSVPLFVAGSIFIINKQNISWGLKVMRTERSDLPPGWKVPTFRGYATLSNGGFYPTNRCQATWRSG